MFFIKRKKSQFYGKFKADFVYCSDYSNVLCYLFHINKDNHKIITINRYDSLCGVHLNLYCFNCFDCKKHKYIIINLNLKIKIDCFI